MQPPRRNAPNGYVTVPRWLARLIPSELTLIKLLCGSALLVALLVGAQLLGHEHVPPAKIALAAGMVIVAASITALTVRAWLRRGIDG